MNYDSSQNKSDSCFLETSSQGILQEMELKWQEEHISTDFLIWNLQYLHLNIFLCLGVSIHLSFVKYKKRKTSYQKSCFS